MEPLYRVVASTASTNDDVAALVRAGCGNGVAIACDEQRAGRGRRGRAWVAPPGDSLAMSIALVLPGIARIAALIPAAVGVATARTIASRTGCQPQLKWPNDLLLEGRKVGGILCEGVLDGSRMVGVVAGIGVNVRGGPDAFPESLRGALTTLERSGARGLDVHALGAAIRPAVVDEIERLLTLGARPLLDAWRARDATVGRRVQIEDGTEGVAEAIGDDGALVVRCGDGALRRVVAGEVRFV